MNLAKLFPIRHQWAIEFKENRKAPVLSKAERLEQQAEARKLALLDRQVNPQYWSR